jgi:hypothetical protein
MPKTQDNLVFKNELAVTELITQFRHDNTWLAAVKSKPEWVGNDVIKIPVRGTAPKVLINNTIYPINSDQREDGKVVISLYKYETENTEVTTDELYALPYEKVNDVQVQHRETLEDVTAQHALHSIAPQTGTATTLIIETTGDDDGTGRKRLRTNDLITAKKKLDKLKVPKEGRVLVLCSDHVADLLLEDKSFNVRYQNTETGAIAKKYYGFEIYESTYAPTYNASNVKDAFETATPGLEASVFFHKNFVVKAPGTAERYAVDKANNPKYRRHEIGFEIHWVCVAIKDEGTGAIVSKAA